MYNFPDRVGINIELDTLIELAKHPRIIGVKESSGDFSHALALVQANIPNFQVVCGCDDQAADFLFWGITSWISGSANVFPGERSEERRVGTERKCRRGPERKRKKHRQKDRS